MELFDFCRSGKLERVKTLLTRDNINSRDTAGRNFTPLHLAAECGHEDIVRYLLQHGANVHAQDDYGRMPIHSACFNGHLKVVNLLLQHGADPNARDNKNYTPLHMAAKYGRIDICIVLLQHRADLSITNSNAKTALDLAVNSTRAVLTGEYKKDELLDSAKNGDEERLLSLLTPQNVNCRTSDGKKMTPLHLATVYNKKRTVQLLLQHGADSQAKDGGLLTPLHLAAEKSHDDIIELLLRHKAEVNVVDIQGQTPLHKAAQHRHLHSCRLLVHAGSDPHITSLQGFTAFQLFNQNLQDMRRCSAEVLTRNLDHKRQIPHACKSEYLQTVKVLPLLPLQADDSRDLLRAAMPPSALPTSYKPQIINVSAFSDLSSGSSSAPQPPTSHTVSQDSHQSVLLRPAEAEGAVGVERTEEEEQMYSSDSETEVVMRYELETTAQANGAVRDPDPPQPIEEQSSLTAPDILANLALAIDRKNVSRFNIIRSNVWDEAVRRFKHVSYSEFTNMFVKFSDDAGTFEEGFDEGGPRWELLTLLMRSLQCRPIFGGLPSSRYLVYNSRAVREDEYFLAGKMIAVSIVHGGPGPHFLSKDLVNHIVGQPSFSATLKDITDEDTVKVLQEIQNASTLESLQEVIVKNSTLLQTAGCLRCVNCIEEKHMIVDEYVRWYVIDKNHSVIKRFKDGLATLQFLTALQKHPNVLAPFLYHTEKNLTASELENLFKAELGLAGSNQRQKQSKALCFWSDYLLDCEEHQTEVSLKDVLMFATGLTFLPPAGITPTPCIVFLPASSPFPMANTCTNTLKLPLSETYSHFKARMDFGIQNSPGFGRV